MIYDVMKLSDSVPERSEISSFPTLAPLPFTTTTAEKSEGEANNASTSLSLEAWKNHKSPGRCVWSIDRIHPINDLTILSNIDYHRISIDCTMSQQHRQSTLVWLVETSRLSSPKGKYHKFVIVTKNLMRQFSHFQWDKCVSRQEIQAMNLD